MQLWKADLSIPVLLGKLSSRESYTESSTAGANLKLSFHWSEIIQKSRSFALRVITYTGRYTVNLVSARRLVWQEPQLLYNLIIRIDLYFKSNDFLDLLKFNFFRRFIAKT